MAFNLGAIIVIPILFALVVKVIMNTISPKPKAYSYLPVKSRRRYGAKYYCRWHLARLPRGELGVADNTQCSFCKKELTK